jgi:glutathione S-transferase
MPALVGGSTGASVAESDTIARYMLSTYPQGPSFQLDNPKSNQIARLHDMYLTTIQGCMYKAVGPFGTFWTRKDALAECVRQWHIIEDLIEGNTLYLCGDEVSLADATVFPSAVFAVRMLPKFDVSPALPPKLQAWFDNVREKDAVFGKVYEEIQGALDGWEAKGRWNNILGAGLRDEAPATIFDKIIAGDIPASVVKEDAKILAFKDINPAAPAHVVIIPKDRNGLTSATCEVDLCWRRVCRCLRHTTG